jgi:hypothetical protein
MLVLAIALTVLQASGETRGPEEQRVQRYALLIGANHGNLGEETLHYAGSDAGEVAKVLTSVGEFGRDHVSVMLDPGADAVRDAFAAMKARMSQDRDSGLATLFFVYYSGHADALAMHLGGTLLRWDELLKLTNQSSATTRLVVVDACRSGTLTRSKGARLTHAFALPQGNDESEVPEGLAILASTSADEAAQESDDIEGSFFTHHLLAALRGAGDINADGRVSLNEAFQYSADRTAFTTAETMAGVQHATYRYRLRGRTDLALTSPAYTGEMAGLALSTAGSYRFLRGSSSGALALEAVINGGKRSVWLPPGRYYVQQRTPSSIREGYVSLRLGRPNALAEETLQMVDSITVATKGGSPLEDLWSVSAWGGSGAPLLRSFGTPWTAALLASRSLGRVVFDVQARMGQSRMSNTNISTLLTDYGAAAGARYTWDFGSTLQLSAGARVGGLYAQQAYTGPSATAPRWRFAPHLDAVVRADLRLGSNWFFGLEGNALVAPLTTTTGGAARNDLRVQPIFALGVGALW